MTERALGNVFFLGGTGMFAPAARWIAPHATSLTLAARNPDALATQLGATALPLDWSIPNTSLPDQRFDMVITWLHDDATWLARPCEDLLTGTGRSIRIHGANSADPAIRRQRDPNPRTGIQRQTVILGWWGDATAADGKRWLSDEEASAGVVHAVETPTDTLIVIGDMKAL